jgi:hypothetical protein
MPIFFAVSLETGAMTHNAKHLPGATNKMAKTVRLHAIFIPKLLFGFARFDQRYLTVMRGPYT